MNKHSVSPELLAMALGSTNDGIVITTAPEDDCKIIYVNKAFLEITGHSEEEVLGRNTRFLQGKGTSPDAREALRNAIRAGQSCVVRIKNFKKDGDFFWNELSLSPVIVYGSRPSFYIGVQKDVTREVEKEERVNFLVSHDELTQLLNFRGIYERGAVLLQAAKSNKEEVCVGVLDIDRFKQLNDTLGHGMGNHVLQLFSKALKTSFRALDIIGRLGGDEFVICAKVSAYEIDWFYRRVALAEQEVSELMGGQWDFSVSRGFVFSNALGANNKELDALIGLADAKMYEDKKNKKALRGE